MAGLRVYYEGIIDRSHSFALDGVRADWLEGSYVTVCRYAIQLGIACDQTSCLNDRACPADAA